MRNYILKRFFNMILILIGVSMVAFIIIQLPPGDFLTSYINRLRTMGTQVTDAQAASLRQMYDLDKPLVMQYLGWMWKLLQGNLGFSFEWNASVKSLLAERLPYTIFLSLITLVFTYVVAIPIGIYSATHQYSFGDYLVTFIGFIGLALPGFLLALILMFVFFKYFGMSTTGLFSTAFVNAPWSLAKFWDLAKHLPLPIIVVGLSGTAGIIRVMRACLLDELRKQYVTTARAKGVKERKLLFEYPVRIAINPIISTIGWTLPGIVSGETIVAIVFSLPTVGPLLYRSLLSQDMYLAGSILLILTGLTVIGTFLSDILLAVTDPRIRLEKQNS
jgi:peptide/nickel transport system permease protein